MAKKIIVICEDPNGWKGRLEGEAFEFKRGSSAKLTPVQFEQLQASMSPARFKAHWSVA